MKILQVCHKPPVPAVDGGCIAIHNITRGLLHAGNQVKVITIATPKHPFSPEKIPEDYLGLTQIESVFVNTSIQKRGAIKSLLSNQSYHVNRFISKEFSQKLVEILKKETFDIIQLESIFVAPYISIIRQHSKAKIVLRTHNIEHLIWERMVEHETNLPKRLLLKRMTKLLKEYECSLFSRIDGFMAISEPDFNFFNSLNPSTPGVVIPFGIDLDNYEIEDEYIPSESPELFHIGSMNWLPNIEGLSWFFDEVWNSIIERYPYLTFTVAGRNIPKEIKNLASKSIIIAGEVENANEFMLSKDIMVVPLLSGSGIRIKILEGMALGKTIITTSIGAEGLAIEDGKNILIANTPEEFVNAVEKCIKTPDICTIVGENARHYIALYHNNEIITDMIMAFYSSIL